MIVSSASKIKLVPSEVQHSLLSRVRTKRHTLQILLMLDAGLRVSEVCTMRMGNIDSMNNMIHVRSLKKRKKEVNGEVQESTEFRTIPMTDRLRSALADHFVTVRDKSPDGYLFATKSAAGHIGRRRVAKMVKKYSDQLITPHMLRHTFATKLVNEMQELGVAQKLLGHKSRSTTEIYYHVDDNQKRMAIEAIQPKPPFYKRWFKPKIQKLLILDDSNNLTKIHVGRETVLKDIQELFDKRVNILLVGLQGTGKTHILNRFDGDQILRIDDLKGLKKTLGNLLIHLYLEKKKANIIRYVMNLDVDQMSDEETKAVELSPDVDHSKTAEKVIIQDLAVQTKINRVLSRSSIQQITELLIKTTEKKEFTLLIDDLTQITTSGVRVMEVLKNHFHIIAAARQIKIAHASFLTNFQKVDLPPFTRLESVILINKLTESFRSRIGDYEVFKNHIIEQTTGVPLFIYEMVERYKREPEIDMDNIRDIRHTTSLKEIDFSLPVLVAIASLAILRYVGPEMGSDSGAFKAIGGGAMILCIYGRYLFMAARRRFV